MSEITTGCVRCGFMIEAMVAAGARKSGEAYRAGARELCEDCAGFRSIGDCIIFWICDGRSNDHVLVKRASHPGLNSRILAQDLSEGFGAVVTEGLVRKTGLRGINLQKELFENIAEDWQKRLSEYVAGVENEGKLDKLLVAMPPMADGTYGMEWSSTLLGGVYNENEGTLGILNIGSGGAVVIGEESRRVAPKTTGFGLIATISRGETIDVKVCHAKLDTNWEEFEEVTYFLAMSDGVSHELDSLLYELEGLRSVPISELRRRLLTRGELTYDDQAVIIGRLMPE